MSIFSNKPQFIVIHHCAVFAQDKDDQFEAVKKYHIGKGWGDIGYHYTISRAGTLHAGRVEKQVGAHCKEQSMNYKSIGIMLDGNFDNQDPSDAQKATLKNLLHGLTGKYKIPVTNIVPHRKFATYKSCPGSRLSDDWAQKLVYPQLDSDLLKKLEGQFIQNKDTGAVFYIKNGKKLPVGTMQRAKDFILGNKLQVSLGGYDSDLIPNA